VSRARRKGIAVDGREEGDGFLEEGPGREADRVRGDRPVRGAHAIPGGGVGPSPGAAGMSVWNVRRVIVIIATTLPVLYADFQNAPILARVS